MRWPQVRRSKLSLIIDFLFNLGEHSLLSYLPAFGNLGSHLPVPQLLIFKMGMLVSCSPLFFSLSSDLSVMVCMLLSWYIFSWLWLLRPPPNLVQNSRKSSGINLRLESSNDNPGCLNKSATYTTAESKPCVCVHLDRSISCSRRQCSSRSSPVGLQSQGQWLYFSLLLSAMGVTRSSSPFLLQNTLHHCTFCVEALQRFLQFLQLPCRLKYSNLNVSRAYRAIHSYHSP